jgi:L-ascorbate metabolism protein UlaG (beta-lactamase superfamily)
MRLTKLGHSCVRLERDGQTLVIDPGGFSEPDAAVGADAVLITHEHPDHLDEGRLRAAVEARPGVEIWSNLSVVAQLQDIGARVHPVGDGDTFTAAGFDVQVHGTDHAAIHPDIPIVRNVGFLIDRSVFDPGDALTVPDAPVAALLLPIHAPWLKASEAIDYVRAVAPARTFALHDGMLNDRGLGLVDRIFSGGAGLDLGTAYEHLQAGASEDL